MIRKRDDDEVVVEPDTGIDTRGISQRMEGKKREPEGEPRPDGPGETPGDAPEPRSEAAEDAAVAGDSGRDGPESAASDDGPLELPEEVSVPRFPAEPSTEDKVRIAEVVEALLFASTESLTTGKLSEAVGVSVETIKECLEVLEQRLERERRPYRLRQHGTGWRLYTREDFYPFLLRLRNIRRVDKLTPAALETLAIIAYRQPVIRAEIEAIRGVQVGPMLRALLDRKLIRVTGRADVPGGPLQYGTTQTFLDRFGLKSIRDLPSLKEFKQGRI